MPLSIVAQNAPGLEISDLQFTYDVNRRFNQRGSIWDQIDHDSPTVTEYPVQELSALFRNIGTKAIKSVWWECLSFRDASEMEVARVYSVNSKTTLLPGETIRLRKSGYNLQTSPYKKVRITRVEYLDGTIWHATKMKR